MVVRGWGGSVATAVGAAAAAGAAQLGVGYGLAIIAWPAANGETASQLWYASLGWATWIAASSTVVGAIIADRLGTRPTVPPKPAASSAVTAPSEPASDDGLATVPASAPELPSGDGGVLTASQAPDRLTRLLWRLVLATAAALGAAATVLLVAVPARHAAAAETTSPHTVAAGYAVLGVLVGLVLAVGALSARAVAANLLATIGWLWLLAAAVVGDGVAAGRDWARVPLGFWELGGDGFWFRNVLLPDAGIAIVAALVIGALAALAAARRGDTSTGVVVSGATGPLLLAVAYLLAQPDLATAAAVDLSRQLVAPYLVLAGLAGSLLVGLLPPRTVDSDRPNRIPTPRADSDQSASDRLAG